jgi:hypothetical protein
VEVALTTSRHATTVRLPAHAWTLTLLASDEPAKAPPKFETTEQGAVPDFVGRWLVVGQLWLPNGARGPCAFTHLWEASSGSPFWTGSFGVC